MTCIAGYIKGKDVYIGGDSWFGDINSYSLTKSPKVRPYAISGLASPILIGVSGAFRPVTVLDRMEFPPMIADHRKWAEGIFIDALRQALWANGYIGWVDGQEMFPEWANFLMGFAGELYVVESNLQVIQVAQPYVAIGAGEWHAEGAFAAMEQLKQAISPKRRVEIALRAAATHSPYVAPPFTIFRTG